MMIALNIYGLVVGVLDWIAGWNYGYLCRKPSDLHCLMSWAHGRGIYCHSRRLLW